MAEIGKDYNPSRTLNDDSVSFVLAMKDSVDSMLLNLINIRDNVAKSIEEKNKVIDHVKNIIEIKEDNDSDVEIISEPFTYNQMWPQPPKVINIKQESVEPLQDNINNNLTDILFKIKLLNLHPRVEYNEITYLMSDMGFDHVEDIVLTNRPFDSISVVSFTNEIFMLEALKLSGKIIHRERIITIEQG